MATKVLSTKEKALHINIVDDVYGILAEIGGGQEVARAFFQAGGASQTVAKSISAYDKTFSDALYNNYQKGRYVSEDRLTKMLKNEYVSLCDTLEDQHSETCKYFAFADTVETLNYTKTNQAHGWLGVRFQSSNRERPNEVIMHVRLLENDGLLQQYTLGSLGVNLIYACFHHLDKPNEFLRSLMDNLDTDRVDINMVRMSGPDLDYVDNRLLAVQLVKNNMTPAVMFDKCGNVQQPSDMLYKKDVIVLRGSFRPITFVGFDMLKTSYRTFRKEEGYKKDKTLVFSEITMNNLMADGKFDERDFLSRVDILNGMNQNVMISSHQYFYKLVDFFNHHKIGEIRLVLGFPTLENMLAPKYYNDLKGGVLEAYGKLFAENVKVYLYPLIKDGEYLTSKDIKYRDDLKYLYAYLLDQKKIIDIEGANKRWEGIFSTRVRECIERKDESWVKMTPKHVSNFIKEHGLFGYGRVKL